MAEKYYQSGRINDKLDKFIDDLYEVQRFDLWNLEKEFVSSSPLELPNSDFDLPNMTSHFLGSGKNAMDVKKCRLWRVGV